MANLFRQGGLLGPIAPGVSGTVNPLSMLGAGMASGNVGQALAQMAQLQMQGRQLQQDEAYRDAQLAQQRAANVLAQQKMDILQAEAQASAAQRENALSLAQTLPEGSERERALLAARAAPGGFVEAYYGSEGPFEPPPIEEPPKVGDVSGLRKEYLAQSKPFQATRDVYERILRAESTGPGDVSLVTNFIKMGDPTSTVTGEEQATTANAGGVSAQVRGLYNRVVGGGTLDDTTRRQIKTQARQFFESQYLTQQRREGIYQGIASGRNYDVAEAVPDLFGDWRTGIPEIAPLPVASQPAPTDAQSEADALMDKYLPSRRQTRRGGR